MDKLTRILWPYDGKTKQYDSQITKCKLQIQQCEQKIATLQESRPTANEKDILIYQMHLKEKYIKAA
ncbi:MAG: hypothetical protein PHC64_07440 [Candidatus Gastranaerophilales bacterium]|nr:hypothetical protein [Candidatus Gastranaerophilales bacterium]